MRIFINRVKMLLSSTAVRLDVGVFMFFLIAIVFFARNNDWTYDEATSYNGVLNNSIWDVLTYSKFKLANNHLINSLYFILLQHYHFINVACYRLLSLFGFVLFYIANAKILTLLKINKFYIIFLIITPYFFYFTYGRGYGLAIGCIAMSFFYLLKYIQDQAVKHEYLMVFFGVISSLSVFSFLYAFLSILVVFGVFKIKHLKSIHTLFLSALVIALLFYIYKTGTIVNKSDRAIIGINKFNLLKYGTLPSIIADFSYRNYLVALFFSCVNHSLFINYLKHLITICIIIPLFYVRNISFRKVYLTHTKTILGFLIFLSILFMAAAHFLAGALYPLSRAIFYLHYFILLFVLVATVNYSKKALFYIPVIIVFSVSLLYTGYAYYDLSRPPIKQALMATKEYPLCVLFTGDKSLELINNLDGIHKKNIIEGRATKNIIPLVKKDSSDTMYIMCWNQYRDSCLRYFKNVKVYKYRNGYSLIAIFK